MLSNFTVIGGKASEDLARKIASKLKGKYLKSELRIFPDGESKITVSGKPNNGKIVVVQSTYPPVDSNLIQALSLVAKAKKYSSQVYAVIPYLGYARQDKEFLPGEVVTMSLVAKMLQAAGATKVIVTTSPGRNSLSCLAYPRYGITA